MNLINDNTQKDNLIVMIKEDNAESFHEEQLSLIFYEHGLINVLTHHLSSIGLKEKIIHPTVNIESDDGNCFVKSSSSKNNTKFYLYLCIILLCIFVILILALKAVKFSLLLLSP